MPFRSALTALSCAFAMLATSAPSSAQTTSRAPAIRTAPPGVRASSFAGVMANNGALLGTARSYRATFGERGLEYLPALGKDAPRAEPWHLSLRTIRRGAATVLDTGTSGQPERRHDRHAVAYRWPGVTETYAARPDGLEQSFTFAAPLPGSGDLVVRLDVQTALPLAADRTAWWSPGIGGVTVGAVTGIDARGRRCPGTVRTGQDHLELTLPGWFVDSAAFPLVLDPLIGTAIEGLANADCDFPDVAYDAYSDTYCVVWTQFFGGGTTGVVGSVFLNDLTFGYAFAINQTGDEDSVRVTNIAGTGLFVMVWVNYTSGGSSISGLAFEPTQAQATNVWNLYGPGGVSMPTLSGEATVLDDDCLVAWIDDTYGLIGCCVTIDLQFQVSATPLVQLAGGNPTEPAFSKQGGSAGLHLLTWVDRPVGLPGWVRAQVVDHDLNPLGTGVWVQNAPEDAAWPAVDGDGFRFLVAWEEQEALSPSATDIRGRLLTVGPGGVTSQGAVFDVVNYPNDLDFAVDVAMLGDRFGVTYAGQAPNSAFWDDVYFRTLAANGAPIGGELRLDLTLGTAYRYEHAPRLIGRRDGDPATTADDGLLVFADQNVNTADSNVALQLVEGMGPGGPITDLGGGCGPGGLAVANDPFALGNPSFRFELFGAQPLSIPFLLLALQGAHTTCGVCSVVNPLHVQFVANTAGYCTASMGVPGDPGLIGVVMEFQFATFQVNYVGCPQAPGLAASNIVRAVLDV